ncbi:MAG: class I SAM-dependent methyltransferase [Acidimicrobiia bacterium]|nr:class I SAM-dependent methyltransferase [Acidimicrobiia bacterium]
MHGRCVASRGEGLTQQRDRWERSWSGRAEDHSWFRARVEPIIAETAAARDFPPGVAVDVGCGAGSVTHFLGERFPLAVGLDLAFHAVAQGRTSGNGHSAAFGVSDACNLPLRDGAASLVVDRGCLHCLTVATAAEYLAEVERVLTPDGRFVLIARTAGARPPLRWTLRHPRGAAQIIVQRRTRPLPGSLARLLASVDALTAFLPDTFEVERVEHDRLRSDAGWHLNHVRLVARRLAGQLPRHVAQVGQEPGPLEGPHGPLLSHVDHQGVARLPAGDEGHDAVVAGLRLLHQALCTVDDPHAEHHRRRV